MSYNEIEKLQASKKLTDNYIDKWYEEVTKRAHEPVSLKGRRIFANKLSDCMFCIGLTACEVKRALFDILIEETAKGKDPLIYYATLPKVLGYWLLQQESVTYDMLDNTIYALKEDTY